MASASLLISGWLLSADHDWKTLAFLLYCNLSGVFLVYRLNDCVDQNSRLTFNLKQFFSYPLHRFVVIQFVVIAIPLAILWLNDFRITVLAVSAIVGVLYSLSFQWGQKQYRIKNIFILKNLLIGAAWGALVLIGSGHLQSDFVRCLFIFCTLQVIIGSVIRDVPDVEKDHLNRVKSLPVVIGEKRTLFLMQLLNLFSFLSLILIDWKPGWLIAFTAVIIWRTINLFQLSAAKGAAQKYWSQTFNLLCCVLIFFAILILRIYGDLQ
ncbi:MAG: UbiA family prenyltransferase [Crocinitomicaceae bacterium]